MSDPQQAAIDMCEAIGSYDKLRLILLESDVRIVSLLEFSFDTPHDAQRLPAAAAAERVHF